MAYQQHIDDAKAIRVNVAIVTLSDTRTPETDTSGQAIRKLLEDAGHAATAYGVQSDDPDLLKRTLGRHLAAGDVDAIITNGGTGISRRDLAIPAIESLIELPLSGFGELFRMLSYEQIGSGAFASRATAGVVQGKLIFALPGSIKAVELAMTKLIIPELRHLIGQLRKA
jgi:molybdenum cofactor biosynthesis protein B